jgi:hypothetical protein
MEVDPSLQKLTLQGFSENLSKAQRYFEAQTPEVNLPSMRTHGGRSFTSVTNTSEDLQAQHS